MVHRASRTVKGGSRLLVAAVIKNEWYVYILLCRDGSVYTGITKDVDRRLREHNSGKGAKYTRSKRPVSLLRSWSGFTHSMALKTEKRIKSLGKIEKHQLVDLDVEKLIERVGIVIPED